MSSRTESRRASLKLQDGEAIRVGSLTFNVVETPGCLKDSIALAGEGIALTGETLMIGSTGKTRFPGSDPQALFQSLKKLSALPGKTLVFPGSDQTDLLCSSIEAELARNPELQMPEAAFVELKVQDLRTTWDDQSASCLKFNGDAAPDYSKVMRLPRNEARLQAPESARASSISIEKYEVKLKQHSASTGFIDVREPDEFAAGHIPGTENIALARIPFEFARLSTFERIYLSCLSGRRSERAANTLCYMGLKDVVNVSGGYKAWLNQGLPIEK
jgi:rhodanese-related sulfurtransferase